MITSSLILSGLSWYLDDAATWLALVACGVAGVNKIGSVNALRVRSDMETSLRAGLFPAVVRLIGNVDKTSWKRKGLATASRCQRAQLGGADSQLQERPVGVAITEFLLALLLKVGLEDLGCLGVVPLEPVNDVPDLLGSLLGVFAVGAHGGRW